MTAPEPHVDRRNGQPLQSVPVTAAVAAIGARRRRAFGHTADRSAVVTEEAEAIRDAARRVLAGETLSSIIKEWNARGLTTAGGGPWRVNSLSTLLLQPRLVGLGRDGSQPVLGPAAILDWDTHAKLVALHESRGKAGRRATKRYLLTGLLRCWRCGGGLRGMPRGGRADLYVCPGPPHGGCSGTAVTADHADNALRDIVLAHLESPELLAPNVLVESAVDRAVARFSGEVASLNHGLAELADTWAAGNISRSEWLSLRRPITHRIATIEAEVLRLTQLQEVRRLASTGRALGHQWSALSPVERRRIRDAVLDRVVVLAAPAPKHEFRPERLQVVWRDLRCLTPYDIAVDGHDCVGASEPQRGQRDIPPTRR